MPINRRTFLKSSAALGAGLAFPLPLFAQTPLPPGIRIKRKTLSVVQGATDESRAHFSVMHEASRPLEAVISGPGETRFSPDRIETFTYPGRPTAISHVYASGLVPGVDHTLSLRSGEIADNRVFRALDPTPSSLRFAICSCMHDRHHDPAIWNDLASQAPDLILFIGDSVYCDQENAPAGEASPATLWRRFSEARETLEIYHQRRLIPIFAVWDDHDFGNNDSNSQNYPFVRESQKNFLTFFPLDPAYSRFLQRGPGVSSAVQFRGQNLLLLDDRSFRMPSGHQGIHAHWGEEQENWAMNLVRRHPSASWLMNGSQFFPSVIWKESVSRNHPKQLESLVNQLRQIGRPVVFASGDVHYSEISRLEPELLGYETFEITSSSIHSQSFPGVPGIIPNKRRIMSTGDRNYVIVTASPGSGGMQFSVESRAPGTRQLFRKDFRL